MTLNANTCHKNEYKSNDIHNTIYKMSHNHANNPSKPSSVQSENNDTNLGITNCSAND